MKVAANQGNLLNEDYKQPVISFQLVFPLIQGLCGLCMCSGMVNQRIRRISEKRLVFVIGCIADPYSLSPGTQLNCMGSLILSASMEHVSALLIASQYRAAGCTEVQHISSAGTLA